MSEQNTEKMRIEALFIILDAQPKIQFPEHYQDLDVSETQGVYVIRGPNGRVLHVGRTLRGRKGLFQRLRNHLKGQSSFVKAYLKGNTAELRNGCTFQCLEVKSDRERALLEHFATAYHCPAHLGHGGKDTSEEE